MTFEMHHIKKREDAKETKDDVVMVAKDSGVKTLLDRLAYPIALILPLSSTAQIWRIWQEKSALGVSPIVWIMLFCTSFFWLFYASVHKVWVIFIGHLLWIIVSAIVLIEIIIY